MLKYAVVGNFYGQYQTDKTFNTREEAINYILSKGECICIRIPGAFCVASDYFYKSNTTEKEWIDLINKGEGHYIIFNDTDYYIETIEK